MRGAALFVLAVVACSPPPAAPTSRPAAAGAPVSDAPRMLSKAPPPLGSDRVSFSLYKMLNEIGAERDTYVALPDGGTEAKAVFSYRDRTSTVPLAASFDFAANGALRRYASWGRTSRYTTIDDQVVARADGSFDVRRADQPPKRVTPAGPAVAASGYATVLAQDLMLRAWQEHGRPAKLAVLPEGEVTIEPRGKESYEAPNGTIMLEHLAVSGLLWGREDVWLDDKGRLAAVVTRDAEFDHHEAAREGFDRLLPELAKRSGSDGVGWLASSSSGAEHGPSGVLVLDGGTLVDGTAHPPVNDAVVVIDGDRIVAAGPRASVKVPGGANVIDARGKWVIPGLWDMHAHVEQVEQLQVYLAAGVTAVRDLGNELDFITSVRDAIDAGRGLGPRVLVDGLVDGDTAGTLGTIRIKSAADIAPTIDRLKKAGCLEVKIYSNVDPALVKPIVAYAHAHGMRAVGHVPRGMTSHEAIEAGYDSISHIHFLFDAVLPDSALKGLSRADVFKRIAAADLAAPALVRDMNQLAARHVFIDDTISLSEQELHTAEENAKREPGISTLPRELQATLGGVPASVASEAEAAFAKTLALLAELHRRGIPIVAGTDINVPGHSLHRELELYVKAGFTPLEALQAATLVPARVMHLDRELGTVEPGKRADLVVLTGDPLADIANVRHTALVVARGRAYDAPALWKLAGFRVLP